MNLLTNHFNRRAQALRDNLPVTSGLYIDVGGTLIRRELYQPLYDFALWNAQEKQLGSNHVFSEDFGHAKELIEKFNVNLKDLDVQEIAHKGWAYNEANNRQREDNLALMKNIADKDSYVVRPSHQLELVIDDRPPMRTGVRNSSLVFTWWNPYDPEVEAFLTSKAYLNPAPTA